MKKNLVLFVLFILPIVAYLFFASGINSFAKLPIITKSIPEISSWKTFNSKPVALTGKISILGFMGQDVLQHKGNIFNLYEKYNLLTRTTGISSITRLVLPYIDNNYVKVQKNGHLFLIENRNKHAAFWRDVYPTLNNNHYKIYESLSSKNKSILDIGYNIGLTSTYFGRISKNVHTVNCNKNDSEKTAVIKNIIRDNCSNVTIYDGNFGEDITFDILNNFLINSNINNYDEFSFININLNGLEENIMQDLYEFQKKIKK